MKEPAKEPVPVKIPEAFICIFTGEMMKDPVMIPESGWSYERAAIEEWLKDNDTCPKTRIKTEKKLIKNFSLGEAIVQFLIEHPEVIEMKKTEIEHEKNLENQIKNRLITYNHTSSAMFHEALLINASSTNRYYKINVLSISKDCFPSHFTDKIPEAVSIQNINSKWKTTTIKDTESAEIIQIILSGGRVYSFPVSQCDGIILLFDLSDKDALEGLQSKIDEIKNDCKLSERFPFPHFLIVGITHPNNENVLTYDDLDEFKQKNGCFGTTDDKENHMEIFKTFAKHLHAKEKQKMKLEEKHNDIGERSEDNNCSIQ